VRLARFQVKLYGFFGHRNGFFFGLTLSIAARERRDVHRVTPFVFGGIRITVYLNIASPKEGLPIPLLRFQLFSICWKEYLV
jgi:hypothetical protein